MTDATDLRQKDLAGDALMQKSRDVAMQRDGEIPEASDVNSFRRRTLIIFHKYAANLRSTKLRRGCGVNTNLCGTGRSNDEKTFFPSL